MKRNVMPHHSKRLGLLSGPVVLSLTLVAGACSSDDLTSRAAAVTTETAATVASTIVALPSTTAPVPVSSAPVSTDAAPPSTAASPSASAPNRSALDAVLDEIETRGFSGVVAVRDGSDVTARAYGLADRENDVSIDAETVFDVGSISKQFTAAAILRLEMDGRLSVADTLGDHVPGLPDDKTAITLHQLLTHTSGVADISGPDDETVGRAEYLARFAEAPLESEPGDRYAYSNVGYSLLAIVIELVTGEPYEAYLRTAMFEPSGMLDTGYVLPDWDDHTIAVGYDRRSGDRFGRPNEQAWDVDGPFWNLRGNGGLMSTAADMLRWDEALVGDRVLDEMAKAKLFAPHVQADGVAYGYGWQIVPTSTGAPIITHNGGNGIFFADFWRFVDHDVAVYITTNSYEVVHNDLALDVANRVLDGDLERMLGGEYEAEAVAPSARICRSQHLSTTSLPDDAEIDALPDTVSGRIARIFIDLIADGDAAARLDFATANVAAPLDTGDPVTVANDIEGIQRELSGLEAARTFQQDDRQFHVLMTGPDVDLLMSLGFDETNPNRLACLAFST